MVPRRPGDPVTAGEADPAAGEADPAGEAVVVVVGAAQAVKAATESETASSVEFHLRMFLYLAPYNWKRKLINYRRLSTEIDYL
jgi:hypothetical protein